MNDFCDKCRVQLSDYEGNFDDILEEVKIEPSEGSYAPKPQRETPGAPEIVSNRENGSNSRPQKSQHQKSASVAPQNDAELWLAANKQQVRATEKVDVWPQDNLLQAD